MSVFFHGLILPAAVALGLLVVDIEGFNEGEALSVVDGFVEETVLLALFKSSNSFWIVVCDF